LRLPLPARRRKSLQLIDAAVHVLEADRKSLADTVGQRAARGIGIESGYDGPAGREALDIVARYGLEGLAGTIVEQSGGIGSGTVPDFFAGGLGTSFGTIVGRRFPTMSVGLQIDLPLGNRTARANLAKTTITSRQLARTRDQLEQTIEVQVRNSMQTVTSSQARLRAAASAARNSQQQYESEQRRFESGLGTVFLVLQRQTALVTSQAQEVRARADLNQAIAALNRALGVTLERHGVLLESASNPTP
jgi:hypothetical protein